MVIVQSIFWQAYERVEHLLSNYMKAKDVLFKEIFAHTGISSKYLQTMENKSGKALSIVNGNRPEKEESIMSVESEENKISDDEQAESSSRNPKRKSNWSFSDALLLLCRLCYP